MGPLSLGLLAVGLAMDAFSVSVCNGMTMHKIEVDLALRMAAFFGGFQMLMPLLGWLGGLGLIDLIAGFDHWVAFGLLALIGGKMVHESTQGENCERVMNARKLAVLFMLAIATSIDALAVGLSLAALKVAITTPILVIGAVTFCLSLVGTALGRRFGYLLQNKAELLGGLILIGIGLKIVVEHLV